jgi:chromosome transmission fidelity protein 18
MIRSATVGMKEADTTITSVLNSLFAPMTRKRVNELGINQEEELMYVERLSREVDASGKEDSIALGTLLAIQSANHSNLLQVALHIMRPSVATTLRYPDI